LTEVSSVRVELYGSLAPTGQGHGSDRAIILGLMGKRPDEVDPASIEPKHNAVRRPGTLMLNGVCQIEFDATRDIIFHLDKTLPAHSNAMRFTALNPAGNAIASEIYYSVGGGFIQKEGVIAAEARNLFPNFDLPGTALSGLLTGAAGQINGTTSTGHNVDRVGVGTGVYSLGAPRQVEFGLRLTF
jgi:L-serine dehydratase